jgi:hypothetical protein
MSVREQDSEPMAFPLGIQPRQLSRDRFASTTSQITVALLLFPGLLMEDQGDLLAVNSICRPKGCHSARPAQLASAAITVASNLSAHAPQTNEYQLRAAYLAKFPEFVEWPASVAKSEPFNVRVLGQDSLGEDLDSAVAGETINSRPIRSKENLAAAGRAELPRPLHQFFRGRSMEGDPSRSEDLKYLIVSDMRELAQRAVWFSLF